MRTMTQGIGPPVDDKWGRDPSVQSMRRVFVMMEQAQKEILGVLRISPLDQRLRLWRQNALRFFEQEWNHTTRQGHHLDERQIADLYSTCFAGILEKAGIPLSPASIPSNEEVK